MAKSDYLIYAVGGGHGHAVRGLVLAHRLYAESKAHSIVLIRPGALSGVSGLSRESEVGKGISCVTVSERERLTRFRANTIIVDTFPEGWQDELPQGWLASFSRRIFVARYSRSCCWDMVRERFDEIWLPYSTPLNEWDYAPSEAKIIGLLTKALPSTVESGPGRLAVIDPGGRLSMLFRERILQVADPLGFGVDHYDTLPQRVPAEKVLVVGAGYHTVYELYRPTVDVRFVPLNRRHDDQYRRVRRLKRGIESWTELRCWLAGAADGEAPAGQRGCIPASTGRDRFAPNVAHRAGNGRFMDNSMVQG